MFRARSMFVALAVAIALTATWTTGAMAIQPHPIPAIECPPSPCCCVDATVCVVEEVAPVCYTEAGVRAFVTLFRDAAAKGVENATVRAFNATKVAPDCIDCDEPKK
jgi:hypothetical protein